MAAMLYGRKKDYFPMGEKMSFSCKILSLFLPCKTPIEFAKEPSNEHFVVLSLHAHV